VVLDPFFGSGTAIAVAERLKRRWIGIDITYLAINLVQRRLRDHFHDDLSPYEIIGAHRRAGCGSAEGNQPAPVRVVGGGSTAILAVATGETPVLRATPSDFSLDFC
jgi:hypothetical protein